MPGFILAGLVVASLASPAAPPFERGGVAVMQKVCGMRMVIGDASLDRGILIDPPREIKADDKRDDSSCGSVKLVRPVRKQE